MAIAHPKVPRLMVIVDRASHASREAWIRALIEMLGHVAGREEILVQARNKQPESEGDLRAVEAVDDRAAASCLIVNAAHHRPGWAGLHWPEAAIPNAPPVGDFFRGASVHCPAALRRAEAAGAKYALFGPVFDPQSKSARGVGVDALRKIVRQATIPVLAVGGITKERIAPALEAGAYGVAAIHAVRDFVHLAEFSNALFAHLSFNPNPS